MKKPRAPKRTYGLYVGSRSATMERGWHSDVNSGAVKLWVVEIDADGKITNPTHTDTYEKNPFNGLYFTAYWQGEGEAYGWHVDYRDLFSVDLRDAERMLKVLRKLRKIKLPVQPTTFGQWAVLTAKALGIATVVHRVTDHPGADDYSENRHNVYTDGSSGQLAIDREIAKVREAQKAMAA